MKARSRGASSSTRPRSTSTPRRIDSAARWVDGVGIAALFPGSDLVLPSLWEAIAVLPRRRLGDPRREHRQVRLVHAGDEPLLELEGRAPRAGPRLRRQAPRPLGGADRAAPPAGG